MLLAIEVKLSVFFLMRGTYKFLNFLNFFEQFLFAILLGGEQFVFNNARFLLNLLIFQLIVLRFDFSNFDCVLNERSRK